MELNVSNDERNMRDKMLRHEFSFEPEDWQAMAALLEEERHPGSPPPSAGAEPGESNKPWRLLLMLLLCVSLLGSVSVFWRPWTDGPDDSAAFSNQPDGPGVAYWPDLPSGAPGVSAPGSGRSEMSPGAEVIDVGAHVGSDEAETSGRRPLPLGLSAVRPKTGEDKSSRVLPSEEPYALAETAGETGLPTAPRSEKDVPALRGITSGQDNSSERQDRQPAAGMVPFDLLPLRSVALSRIPAPYDSLIRPAPARPPVKKRWERAWIFGAHVNAVDYRPFRVSAGPHFGHLVRYRFNPRSALQAELQVKFVSGYGFRAEFNDIIPGGSFKVVVEADNLLYFEAPILWHRTYSPEKAWLIGLKPSWNVAVFPYGTFAGYNNGPNRRVTAHSGIRNFDLGLVLGWEWQFGRRWALDLRYNQGLFDLTYDNFFNSRETHLNSDVLVSLRYFLGK